jgi:hypothetical protein
MTVRDRRRDLRGVVVFVLQLAGYEECRNGERSEVIVRYPVGSPLGVARRAARVDRLGE